MNLFAYGTLMWPEVLEAVIGRRLLGTPALLQGYVRLRVKGEHYPVIIPSASDSVEGVLIPDLTDLDFDHLDLFEGREYERVTAHLNGLEVHVYVLSSEWRHIADTAPWHPAELQEEHLSAFCREYKGWPRRKPNDGASGM